MTSHAYLPSIFNQYGRQDGQGRFEVRPWMAVIGGVVGLALLAQVSIPLPFTPVPVTGQTFGVTLIALLMGRKLGLATVLSYLAVGAIGMPVFALGKSGLVLGPTLGYLAGMVVSVMIVGGLADRGYARTFGRALIAGFSGSVAVLGCGLLGLSLFMPTEVLWTAGVLPFIPGDLIKTTLAASIATTITRRC